MSFLSGQPQSIPMPEVPAAPLPPSQPQGVKPKPKSTAATFLGADATPTASQVGNKTLIGQ